MVWSLKCCFAVLFLSTIQPSRTRAMTTRSPSGRDTCGRLRQGLGQPKPGILRALLPALPHFVVQGWHLVCRYTFEQEKKQKGTGAPGWQLLTFNSLNWWGQKVARGFTSSSTLKSPWTEALGFHRFAVLSLAYMRTPPHRTATAV